MLKIVQEARHEVNILISEEKFSIGYEIHPDVKEERIRFLKADIQDVKYELKEFIADMIEQLSYLESL